jgi:hypothetical protein
MSNVRGKSPITMLVILVLTINIFSAIVANTGHANSAPSVWMSPASPVYNPGDTFTVDINVNVSELIQAWEVELTYDTGILEFPAGIPAAQAMLNEGPFLNSTGPTLFVVGPPNLALSRLVFGVIPLPPTGIGVVKNNGTGVLANVTFTVKESGVCNITLNAKLTIDGGGLVQNVTSTGAFFSSTKPFVDFEWTPYSPSAEINESITFNASACFDPGGDNTNITSYRWDFGDGNVTTVGTPVIVHKFGAYNTPGWPVNLTATDDDAETWSKVQLLRMWHDVVASDIWPTGYWWDGVYWEMIGAPLPYYFPFEMNVAEVDMILTETNLGTYTDTTNVSLWFDLNATVLGDEIVFTEYDFTLPPMTGSGFGLMFFPDISTMEGNYTVSLYVAPVPGETDTGNNLMSVYPLEIHNFTSQWKQGDADLNGEVDIADVVKVALAFGSSSGASPNIEGKEYDPAADLNEDGEVDVVDLVMVAMPSHYGLKFDTSLPDL